MRVRCPKVTAKVQQVLQNSSRKKRRTKTSIFVSISSLPDDVGVVHVVGLGVALTSSHAAPTPHARLLVIAPVQPGNIGDVGGQDAGKITLISFGWKKKGEV